MKSWRGAGVFMQTCIHCAIEMEGKGFETPEGLFCCERCHKRALELNRVWQEREEAYIATINAIVTALDIREHGTGMHSQRVSEYTRFLAQKARFPEEECLAICRGALLHDIGKIGIPDAVLLKQGELTAEEWTIMKQHPALGYRLLAGIPFLQTAAAIVYAHHERFDGSGYPLGLKGKATPVGARLFAIADTVDAITSDRPYHAKESFSAACETVRGRAGKDFDPELVTLYLTHAEEFREKFQLE